MFTVTAIQTGRTRSVRIHLDTGSAFNVGAAAAVEAGVCEGQALSGHEINSLRSAEELHRSLNCALGIIGVRPRSEKEISARLARRGFDTETIQQVLGRLKERGLVDDAAFARFWRDNREYFRPLGSRLLESELRQKGIDADTIGEALLGIDDELGAYRAAQKKVRTLSSLEYSSFRQRLGAFLKRRGFDYAIAALVIDRVWQEQGNAVPD